MKVFYTKREVPMAFHDALGAMNIEIDPDKGITAEEVLRHQIHFHKGSDQWIDIMDSWLKELGLSLGVTREESVQDFHKAFDHPAPKRLDLISSERLESRIDWLKEEMEELREAHNNADWVEILDALTDIQYFLSGFYVEFGLVELADLAFREVHQSNMSKICKTEQEAIETQRFYLEKDTKTKIFIQNGLFVVKRMDDGKILKSVNWKNPKLVDLIERKFNGR